MTGDHDSTFLSPAADPYKLTQKKPKKKKKKKESKSSWSKLTYKFKINLEWNSIN